MTELYRHWNGKGELLYVGISLSAIGRLRQHQGGSPWYEEIANVTIEKFDSREEALAAERKAIRTEHPKHNIQHSQSKHSMREYDLQSREVLRNSIIGYPVRLSDDVVLVEPMYTIDEVAKTLRIGPTAVRRLLDEHKLACIAFDTGCTHPKRRITGFQLLDYLESISP